MTADSEQISSIIKKLPPHAKLTLIQHLVEISNLQPDDLCWCNSRLAFKHCHKYRSSERKLTNKEIRANLSRIFDKERYCCATFDSHNCVLPIKGAHTVQRGKVLSSIAIDGHVGTFYRKMDTEYDETDKLKTGISRSASIFYGFCSYHDTELFKNIEAIDFIATPTNCWSSSYRATCHEYYQKTAAQEAATWLSENADIGYEVHEQILIQESLHIMRHELKKGLRDAASTKKIYEDIKRDSSYNILSSYVITLDKPLQIAACAAISPFYDTDGLRIQNFGNPAEPLQHIAISTTVKNGMACYIITHLKTHKIAEKYMSSVISKGNDFIKSWLFKSIFAYAENNYFNLDWWDNLSEDIQKEIQSLVKSENYTRHIPINQSISNEVAGNIISIEHIN